MTALLAVSGFHRSSHRTAKHWHPPSREPMGRERIVQCPVFAPLLLLPCSVHGEEAGLPPDGAADLFWTLTEDLDL